MKDQIITTPTSSVKEMRGFVKTKKTLSKDQMKKIIKDNVAAKHENPFWK